MRTILKLLITLTVLTSSLELVGQTVWKGRILSDEGYSCYIEEYDDSGQTYLRRFEGFEENEKFNVRVLSRREPLKMVFIADSTQTITTVYVYPIEEVARVKVDIVLNGKTHKLNKEIL